MIQDEGGGWTSGAISKRGGWAGFEAATLLGRRDESSPSGVPNLVRKALKVLPTGSLRTIDIMLVKTKAELLLLHDPSSEMFVMPTILSFWKYVVSSLAAAIWGG